MSAPLLGALAAFAGLEVSLNSRTLNVATLGAFCLQLTGCELVKGIFKAGVWVGVLGVFAVLVLAGWALSRLRR